MSWFILTLICMAGWGLADLFYKKSNLPGDRYSHLKTAVWVGLMMGLTSMLFTVLTLFKEPIINIFAHCFPNTGDRNAIDSLMSFVTADTLFSPGSSVFLSAVRYLPASLGYIISMVIGYAGMRYLEVSIVSPIQNSSGALSAAFLLIYLALTGNIGSFWDNHGIMDIVGTLLIIIGVMALSIVEQRLSKTEATRNLPKVERKYRYGALALIFPILYCVFDTIGTTADGIILDKNNGLGLGSIDVIILYGFTFLLAGITAWAILFIKEKKAYNPFNKQEIKTRGSAAIFEQFGQIFYVYAMANNPVVAAPMIASYCVVSSILSRIFLQEKLKISQYICIFTVIIGVLILGVIEGIGES